jgi:hypothetical protein
MKKIATVVLLSMLFANTIKAQNLNGTYQTEDQNLTFIGDSVIYNLRTHGCLIYIFKGTGNYRIVKNRLFITPLLHAAPQFKVDVVEQRDLDSVYYKILDPSAKNPTHVIIGASVFVIRNHRSITGVSTDINGFAKFPRGIIRPADSIRVQEIGFYTAKLVPADPNKDLNITMYKGINDEYFLDFLSNHHKGYPFKVTPKTLNIDFEKQSSCGKDLWIAFTKKEE